MPAVDILALEHRKAEAAERAADGAGIAHGLFELLVWPEIAIAVDTDDEGKAGGGGRPGRAPPSMAGNTNKTNTSNGREQKTHNR